MKEKIKVKVVAKNDDYTGQIGVVIEQLVFDSSTLIEFTDGVRRIYYNGDLTWNIK
jgi:hypothetical protein